LTVIDWSAELTGLLSQPGIHPMIENVLDDPRVTLIQNDARVAVKSFGKDSFDAIIDNLSFPSWPGATGIKSVTFFKTLHEILKKEGHYYHMGNFHEQEKPRVIRSIFQSFPVIQEHRAENDGMLIAGNNPWVLSENDVNALMAKDSALKRSPDYFGTGKSIRENPFSGFRQNLTLLEATDYETSALIIEDKPDLEYFLFKKKRGPA